MKYTFEKAEKSTVKVEITLTAAEWKEAINLTYTSNVDVKEPKLKLSKKTVTLNANEKLYR